MKKMMIGAGLLALSMAMPARADQPVEFLAFGDTPYNEDQFEALVDVASMLKDRHLPFGIHWGDTKAGGERCTPMRLMVNQTLIFGLIDAPIFVTPGDNDWTDCDRKGDDELVTLDTVFKPLYYVPEKLPEGRYPIADWQVMRQPRFVENASWRYGNVVFATLHIVGTANGRDQILLGDKTEALDRVDARDDANLEWLAEAFLRAADAEALVLSMQADMTVADKDALACSPSLRTGCNAYKTFENALEDQARRYGKPVLLMHGDTGPYCLDKGFLGQANLWRFNGPGDYKPGVAVVRFEDGAFSFSHVGDGDGYTEGCPETGE